MNLPNNSLNTEKIVLMYSCFGANSDNGTSILDAVYGRGAQCVVAWSWSTDCYHVNGWNQLFFEKIYQSQETILEGFRYADYCLPISWGYPIDVMQGHRVVRGNVYNYLYN